MTFKKVGRMTYSRKEHRLYQGDCLEVLEDLEPVDCIFADPFDNIGLKYNQHKDKLPDHEYIALLDKWLWLFHQKAPVIWFSFNAKWTFAFGGIVHQFLLRKPEWEAKPFVQVFTFGQNCKTDCGNGHRPLWRIKHRDAPLYPDAIKVPSARQLSNDKRAAKGGRVPLDQWEYEQYSYHTAPIPVLSADDISRVWENVEVKNPDDCWLWKGSKHDGYGRVSINGKNYLAHRVIWKMANGIDPSAMSVCHSCDNPPCCNPNHLWVGTHVDNMQDMVKKGRSRSPKGEKHHNSKLTARDVLEIRQSIASDAELSAKFQVTIANVNAIRSGDAWKDGPWPEPTDSWNFPRVVGNSKQRRPHHPTQLNEGLVERAIKLTTTEGQHVLDPFGGTGTTLRVCKAIGRQCTLIEIDPFYCKKIAEEHKLKIFVSSAT